MKKIAIRMIFLLLVSNLYIHAEDNQTWYEEYSSIIVKNTQNTFDKTKEYTNETIHYIQTDDITFEEFYKMTIR